MGRPRGSHTYFDYTEGSGEEEGGLIGAQNTVAKVYSFEPILEGLESQHHHHVLVPRASCGASAFTVSRSSSAAAFRASPR